MFIELENTAANCNALQQDVAKYEGLISSAATLLVQHIATHCNTLQHTTTHFTTLQQDVPKDGRLISSAATALVQHTATHCNTLQLYNTLQQTATGRAHG